jgi:hypothetical protein
MTTRITAIALAACALVVAPATASSAAPARGPLVCTWGGTPDAPTGVLTLSPGITTTPSAGPVAFTATGELGGSEGCNGTLTFRGVLEPGTSCTVATPFHATATGFPPIRYAEASFGPLGTAPVVLYDGDHNAVGSEQAQFLTGTLNRDDPLFTDCNAPGGLARAYWSDTLELFGSRP